MLSEICAARVGDLVDLLAALLGRGHRVAQVFEHRERRVNRTRAGGVAPAGALLELLDDVVAMTGLFIEQAQDDELEVALLEHPAATKGTTALLAAAAE